MRWKTGRRSTNVSVRSGRRGGGVAVGGLGIVVIAVLSLLMGRDPGEVLQEISSMSSEQTAGTGGYVPGTEPGAAVPVDSMADFVSVVLAYTEDVWSDVFARQGADYPEPQLVIFQDYVQSACGMAQSAMGPFYCPGDASVYIDLGFYHDLRDEIGAPGDFAQAYVIAHEVGHHIQNITGVLQRSQRGSGPESDAVRVELQADCFAGVWAGRADQLDILDPGDIEEALNAAARIGDDHLQRQSQGVVVPESFTHGTSEQRARWFGLGFQTGDPARCDTFAATRL